MSPFRTRRPDGARPSVHSSRAHARPVAAPAPARPVAAPPPPPASAATLAAIAASPFTSLGVCAPIVRALLEEGYTEPTPIQAEVVPSLLAGRDVLACAQTGTGKTAAFVVPILQRLADEPRSGRVRALVLTPTRELAAQIGDSIRAYGRHRGLTHAVVYGGVSQQRQEIALRESPELLVATPGRLLDLMQQGLVRLDHVTYFVLDEADRMLDMGFVHDVRRVLAALPTAGRQTLLFSATIPAAIEALAARMLVDPVRVSVKPAVTTAEGVEQSVIFVAKADKRAALERVLGDAEVERAIVFTRTKHGANRLTEQLARAGFGAAVIHGNKSQGARERALDAFRQGTARVLVATDVAARGIDVEGISHVINFDLPNVAESYVHRIGRTGRAGAMGRAISLVDGDERALLADIEKLIRRRLPRTGDEPQVSVAVPPARAAQPPRTHAAPPRPHGGPSSPLARAPQPPAARAPVEPGSSSPRAGASEGTSSRGPRRRRSFGPRPR
jgi:ATP-dependent RNA helicase RhlE